MKINSQQMKIRSHKYKLLCFPSHFYSLTISNVNAYECSVEVQGSFREHCVRKYICSPFRLSCYSLLAEELRMKMPLNHVGHLRVMESHTVHCMQDSKENEDKASLGLNLGGANWDLANDKGPWR